MNHVVFSSWQNTILLQFTLILWRGVVLAHSNGGFVAAVAGQCELMS